MDIYLRSLELHKQYRGKIRVNPALEVRTTDDLSLVYSPGVAEPCRAIAENPESVYDLTMKGNTVAIVSDGSAVLGLGNLGATASIPVMEGKAMLFKKFAGINAFPICIDTQDTEKIIETVKLIAPVFGGVNLEDISAPRSFEIEERLQDIGIPVFHDDQHGTAIVVLGGLYNAAKVLNKKFEDMKVVINGAGAAGVAIAKLIKCINHKDRDVSTPIGNIVMCDSKGIISKERDNLNSMKQSLLAFTNNDNETGTLKDALKDADMFIGVSVGDILKAEDLKVMKPDPIIFALDNPTPEIMPEEAKAGGAAIVATGRSDFANQVNNVLGFPGIFRGALDARAKRITHGMQLAAAHAIAESVKYPNPNLIIPPTLDFTVASNVARAVREQAAKEIASGLI